MVNKARKKIKEEMKDRDEMTESARIYDVRTSGGRLDFLKKVPEIMKICVEQLFLLRLFLEIFVTKTKFYEEEKNGLMFNISTFGNWYCTMI